MDLYHTTEWISGYRLRSMKDFSGRTAIVTGASRGIGQAIAAAILEGGGSVCLTARSEPDLDQAVTELGGGDAVIGVPGPSHDPEHRAKAVARALDCFGSLDMLVNNAATNPISVPLVEADANALRKIFEVNYVAPLAWASAAWRAWMRDHGGAVLNIASVSAVAVDPRLGANGASKAALIHLTRQLALELSPGVRVNSLAPAVVKTQFARSLYADRETSVAAAYPLGRLGVPSDIADAARFLLSDQAGWITGQTLVIDGGITLTSALANEASA
jgi:NAD(P)-dependent dehydrogenase (short-subunit alcohol dehydrogenase family)